MTTKTDHTCGHTTRWAGLFYYLGRDRFPWTQGFLDDKNLSIIQSDLGQVTTDLASNVVMTTVRTVMTAGQSQITNL